MQFKLNSSRKLFALYFSLIVRWSRSCIGDLQPRPAGSLVKCVYAYLRMANI